MLVNGAGGGVGGFAVQLAKHAGAHVIATAGPRSADIVRRFGAEQIVDYTTTSLAEAIDAPVDVVLNLVATDAQRAATTLLPLIRPGGVVVSVTVPIEAPAAVHFVARNDTASSPRWSSSSTPASCGWTSPRPRRSPTWPRSTATPRPAASAARRCWCRERGATGERRQ